MTASVRNTRQKAALREAFILADRPLSPDEVLHLSQHNVPGISIATIYRNIAALVEDGWLAEVQLPGSAARYEVAGKQHHHHFQCKACEKVYELYGCDMPLPASVPQNFQVTGHEFFLYGTCASCR